MTAAKFMDVVVARLPSMRTTSSRGSISLNPSQNGGTLQPPRSPSKPTSVKSVSSIFQMLLRALFTAAREIGIRSASDVVVARLPACARQAAEAVSVCTQVKMEDAPQIVQNSKVRMSRFSDTSSTT